jgi:hypothetical protein
MANKLQSLFRDINDHVSRGKLFFAKFNSHYVDQDRYNLQVF